MYIIGYANLTTISDRNLEIFLIVQEIFPIAFDGYYMVYLSKNLITNVQDRYAIKLFSVVVKARTIYKFLECMQKLKKNHINSFL